MPLLPPSKPCLLQPRLQVPRQHGELAEGGYKLLVGAQHQQSGLRTSRALVRCVAARRGLMYNDGSPRRKLAAAARRGGAWSGGRALVRYVAARRGGPRGGGRALLAAAASLGPTAGGIPAATRRASRSNSSPRSAALPAALATTRSLGAVATGPAQGHSRVPTTTSRTQRWVAATRASGSQVTPESRRQLPASVVTPPYLPRARPRPRACALRPGRCPTGQGAAPDQATASGALSWASGRADDGLGRSAVALVHRHHQRRRVTRGRVLGGRPAPSTSARHSPEARRPPE
eukprot:CAMPEP_0204375780 /NCGR_PEP_ID=MMETSP0469-20131031/49524_1 /ASSEMBLY_ACC=CAM_ASM_000384 /TAXON_ID=2969 /ORGANISM="Oxyrrhis marina" /LENGTH=289 /DNA_ID=CAMNT_0051366529 /DNA_START=213 /DNA_END=1082 /DNA_ORIENTATION=-